jgi:hypothetical protein
VAFSGYYVSTWLFGVSTVHVSKFYQGGLLIGVGNHSTAYVLGENYKLVTCQSGNQTFPIQCTSFLCDQKLMGTLVSAAEILLKVTLNTVTLTLFIEKFSVM